MCEKVTLSGLMFEFYAECVAQLEHAKVMSLIVCYSLDDHFEKLCFVRGMCEKVMISGLMFEFYAECLHVTLCEICVFYMKRMRFFNEFYAFLVNLPAHGRQPAGRGLAGDRPAVGWPPSGRPQSASGRSPGIRRLCQYVGETVTKKYIFSITYTCC